MIKQSVINTFNRVGIDYQSLDNHKTTFRATNRFSGDSCGTTELIAHLIQWVYNTSNDYERGYQAVNVSDFDRVRYFILEQDSNAYTTCID
jgi:hypothetical protein